IAIRVLIDQPMRLESLATWDGGNITWGGRVKALGTVPICVCAQEGLGKGKGWGRGTSIGGKSSLATVGSYTLSWKPCNGGSDDGVTTSLQLSQNSRPPMHDHQDKCMIKAQVHVSKSSAISDVQPLPRRKQYCQIYQVVKHMLRGRLLASFQDREHEGSDTRSQGGIKDNDLKIKIQDHSMQMIYQRNSQYHKAQSFKKVTFE
nr:hypothetical protein [Tanacetum cinerariifolium]